jgi:hypothetical protein
LRHGLPPLSNSERRLHFPDLAWSRES